MAFVDDDVSVRLAALRAHLSEVRTQALIKARPSVLTGVVDQLDLEALTDDGRPSVAGRPPWADRSPVLLQQPLLRERVGRPLPDDEVI